MRSIRHPDRMGAVLHRIEALPGEGRHAVTFRAPDGSEQTAIVHLTAAGLDVAEASLPSGWSRESELFATTADAVCIWSDRSLLSTPGCR